jgi:hypothetical protein
MLKHSPSTRTFRIRLILAVLNLALLAFLFQETRKLRRENLRVAVELQTSSRPSKTVERARLLQAGNERLKKDLLTIPVLAASAKSLQTELEERRPQQTAAWAAASNRLHEAIRLKRDELAGLADWSVEWDRMKLRRVAEARLAEKRLEPDSPADPARLETALQQLGSSTQRRLDIIREWQESDKSPEKRAVFLAGLAEFQAQRDGAIQQLGKDLVLYEEIPVPMTNRNPQAPAFRSLVPDPQGRLATVYVNGDVVWSSVPSVP